MSQPHPYAALTPDRVLDAIESTGRLTDARVFPLNSYENRVYQVGIEGGQPLIAKFYRPDRWTQEQILEEHRFTAELHAEGLSVVPPLTDAEGQSLWHFAGFDFALFARQGGYPPELDNLDHLHTLGCHLGQLHAIGKREPFQYRPPLDARSFGHDSAAFLLDGFIPASLQEAYRTLSRDLLVKVDAAFARFTPKPLRLHGDCHPGNILWRDEVPHLVDFDDARMGPAIQDLWMLLSGDRQQQHQQLAEIIEGYEMFSEFDPRELSLVEPLRTLRMMHYAAWLARRWQDPAFPKAFSWFNTERYWAEHILELREQLAALDEPPLRLQ